MSHDSPLSYTITRTGKHADAWSPGPETSRFQVQELAPLRLAWCPVKRVSIRRQGLPTGRLLFLSDLHWNGREASRYEQLAQGISALASDWLVFGGDAITFMDNLDGALGWLASLKAKKGKIAVSGNRESCVFWKDADYWRKKYQEAGYAFLCNEPLLTDDLLFYGVDDARFGHPAWERLQPNPYFTVTLSHNPDAPVDVPAERFIGDLVLCGHTHGGQIRLPLYGALYSSSAYGRQFISGWTHRSDGTLLHTSHGIGESGFGITRMRLLCPPDMLCIDFSGASPDEPCHCR